MGRKRKNAVHGFFEYDKDTNQSACTISGCVVKVKGLHTTNLLYHLASKHHNEHQLVLRRNSMAEAQSDDASTSLLAVNKKQKKNTDKINHLKEECINLVAVHGRPFSIVDDAAFQNIIAMIPLDKVDLTSIHSRSVKDGLSKKADEMRQCLAIKLRNQLISLKIDGATRQDRAFMGVNIQYVQNGKIHIKHLGVVELHSRSTAEHLKDTLLYVLRRYYISVKQILTITTDNGANYIKIAKLVNDEIGATTECEDDLEEEEGDDTSIENFENLTLEDEVNPNRSGGVDDMTHSSVTSVRCAAHTLQLAVGDALREDEAYSTIEIARSVVRHLRTPSVRQILKTVNKKKAILDCPTRWHSTLDMLQSLIQLREWCSTNPREPSYISNTMWGAINDIIESLSPVKVLTKILQLEQLTIGDFYYYWTKCILETEKITVPLAQYICRAMRIRQKKLMEIPYFVAALYLDPRFQVVLSEEETATAVQFLQSTWTQMLRLNAEKNQSVREQNVGQNLQQNQSLDENQPVDEMEKLLLATERNKRLQQVSYCRSQPNNIMLLLEGFNNHPRISSQEKILHFWETKKQSDPQLYLLANTLLAIPCTQVSVERLFSSLKFVLSDLRYNLKENIVEDILFIRNN